MPSPATPPAKASVFAVITSRKGLLGGIVALSLATTGLTLVLPLLIRRAIDAYQHGGGNILPLALGFVGVSVLVSLTMFAQGMLERLSGEGVARDLRSRLMDRISRQDFAYLTRVTPGKLLTNLTSDAQAVKMFASQAIVVILSSAFMIVGAAVLMFFLDWKLTLVVLAVIPLIGGTFAFIFSKIGPLFGASQKVQDILNRVITESITGAALVRVLNAQQAELLKFAAQNTEAKDLGIRILTLFAFLIPIITLFANLAQLAILGLGGRFAIAGSLSLGDFAAFNAYLALLILPLIMIGFMSNVITQAQVSYGRILEVLEAPEAEQGGTVTTPIAGNLEARDVSLSLGGKPVLEDVSFSVPAGSRTGIIGPTAAGKTQLLYVLAGLLAPDEGTVSYDGVPLQEYDPAHLHAQVALVFQDSVLFNLTLKENVAFGSAADQASLEKAIRTAELQDLVAKLPDGLDTLVSERGLNLSGGQKQRIMLARALALNPRVLLLDDFTARVDAETERKILANLGKEYPEVTLVSVTQKVASVTDFDQALLLEDGEVVARGTHAELLKTSPEYAQIAASQESTTQHE